MSYKWETKFQPGDKVKWCGGKTGTIIQVHIFYPSGEDMDHWRKTLPKIADGKYQHTSYEVKFSDEESHEIAEGALTLIAQF